MHESTVSRIANNKVIRTPAGTFEMSKLFSSRLEKDDGDSTSSARVKILLKQYIDQEDKRKPYSDQKIADYFKEENGIAISRRTVAKYRDELNILSSAKRKEIV
jgi:RNA polymerase sigma-54 factor